jgi:hypothetical protein
MKAGMMTPPLASMKSASGKALADFCRLADAADCRAVYGYGAIREILILRVVGNDVTISDD